MLDELEGAETRARQAEEQTRAFLADAAHELRTPITGVQAAAETLLHHGDQLLRSRTSEHLRRCWSGGAAGRRRWSPTCWPRPGWTPGSTWI